MKRWAVLISLVLVAGAAVFFITMAPGSQKDDDANKQAESSVELEGGGSATQLDPADDQAAQAAIQGMVKANEPDSKAAYKAAVRQDSIVRSTTAYGAPLVRYLVDIAELQRTFVVEQEGDASSDFASVYVRCPEPTDLRYAAKDCQEIE